MRGAACLLIFCLVNPTVAAQPVDPAKSAEDIKAIDDRVDYWRKTCLQDWDAATHMTRKEWRTTCERVATERRIFLLQDPGSFSIKSRQR
jgi:hypothetical protein